MEAVAVVPGPRAEDGPAEPIDSPVLEPPIVVVPVPLPRVLRWAAGRGDPAVGPELTACLETGAMGLAAIEAGTDPAFAAVPETVAALDAAAGDVARRAVESLAARGLLVEPAEDEPREALHRAAAGTILAHIIARLGPIAAASGRSLIPAELHAAVDDFTGRHVAAARAGHGLDPRWLGESRPMVRRLVDLAWARFIGTEAAPDAIVAAARPAGIVALRLGMLQLVRIEQWSHEACLVEPDFGAVEPLRIRAMVLTGRLRHEPPAHLPPPPVVTMGSSGDESVLAPDA